MSSHSMPLMPAPTKMQQQLMPAASNKIQRLRNDRHMFAASDDNAMMKQILTTHTPDGRIVEVKPLISVIENIFVRATPPVTAITTHEAQTHLELSEDKTFQSGFGDMLDVLAFTISKISCEISCKCSGSGDAHMTTVSIFNMLSSYSWDAKVVIVMAAFAVNYGEFWLVAQLYPTNPLAKSVAILLMGCKAFVFERSESLKPRFDALNNLIKAMMAVTKCIVEFQELPTQYITHETPEMVAATAHIPTAVYWTVRSIVACASQIFGLIGMGHEYIGSTTEAWELSSLAHKVNNIHSHLMAQLGHCYQLIDEKRHLEAYQTLVRLFETMHIDNMKILKALIYAKDDQLPLVDGATKRRVSIDVLRRKNVLLLISDLDISNEELFILDQIYTESRQHSTIRTEGQYEVVWLPVVDRNTPWNEMKQKQFETLQGLMPWYYVYHPSLLDGAVIRYIKEVWKFNKKPLLVVLDPQGRVVNPNALHMIWIWQSMAYPFTSAREEGLWKEETWRLELLADNIEPLIFNWIAEQKYICLYGGEDMEWIRKFVNTAQAVARAANIQLEMLYVGKSNPREKVRRINLTIEKEKLGHVLPDLNLIWFFWVRLESMWHSKVQHGRTVENDPIMQEIMTMLSFDGSEQGWAVFCEGATREIAQGKGETIHQSLNKFDDWKGQVPEKGFVSALNESLHDLHTPHHCNRLILPGTTGSIPEKVVCAECGRQMEKYIMYRCCTD